MTKEELCWYCQKNPRKEKDQLFCEECEKIEKKDQQSGVLKFYHKIK